MLMILGSFVSCAQTEDDQTVVIWTNRSEFVPYAEVFNTSQNKVKALVLYKESPAESLPAARDEVPPDLVVGSLMRSDRKRKQFRTLNYLLTTGEIDDSVFYSNLLSSCKRKESVYQLPVSFNIPAIVFARENESFVEEPYMLTPEQIQNEAEKFNKQNRNKLYTQMGFAAQWYPEFLYTFARLNGGNFSESGNSFVCDVDSVNQSIEQLKSWAKVNTSAKEESDFQFKYLYTPSYKQLMSKHCLFAYMPSNELFSLSQSQLENVEFRWIHKDNKIPVTDSMLTVGLYKKARHKTNAEEFLKWFFTHEAQRKMLEHVHQMNLNVQHFGIAGGFSSLQSVTEKLFPYYYTSMLSNAPVAEYLEAPQVLPLRWESLRTRVVIPYILDSVNAEEGDEVRSLEARTSDWEKQIF